MEGLRTPVREGQLVRRLIEQGIRDPSVLAAFARVPRRFFVPEEGQQYSEGDHPLEIGYGQTISQPYIVAAMTEALQLEGRERVLEVGTGSGYQTAILCELLPLASTVRTIEIVPELAGRAERTLRELGYENVDVAVAVHAHVNVYVHVHVNVYVNVYVHVHVYVHVRVNVYVHVHVF